MQLSEFEHSSHFVVCTIITDVLIFGLPLHTISTNSVVNTVVLCVISTVLLIIVLYMHTNGTALSTNTFSTAVLISVLTFGLHSCCQMTYLFIEIFISFAWPRFQCVFYNASSNMLPERMHNHTGRICSNFSPMCLFKCVFKALA